MERAGAGERVSPAGHGRGEARVPVLRWTRLTRTTGAGERVSPAGHGRGEARVPVPLG
jgi:hypothetical protein